MITITLLLTVVTIIAPGGRSDETCAQAKFEKSGCFKYSERLFSELLITDTDTTHSKFGKDVDWGQYKAHMASLACRCWEKAHGKYKYFALGFYGECKAGTNTEEIENMILNPGELESDACVGDNGFYKKCNQEHEYICAGQYNNEYVYEIIEDNICGDILHRDVKQKDVSTGATPPGGWIMCYIDEADTEYHNTACEKLLVNVAGKYKTSSDLLSAGGNFGCWHGKTGDHQGPSYAANNVIPKACHNNLQHKHTGSWIYPTTTFGVCIKIPHKRVNGNWGEWSSYDSCSKICGAGIQTRSRSCTNPAPSNGGSSCPGSSVQTQPCNVQRCPAGLPRSGNLCGDILHRDVIQRDVSTGATPPKGWIMCYIDETDTNYHSTRCEKLLVNIAGKYRTSSDFLSAGGHFGCWHGRTGEHRGPSYATNNVILKACRNNIQHTHMFNWVTPSTTFGVCIKVPSTLPLPPLPPTLPAICGDILHRDVKQRDVSTGDTPPKGWIMCYIDEADDTKYHNTACEKLLVNIAGKYKTSSDLLSAGGNFGCWHGKTGDHQGPSYAGNAVIRRACHNNVQHKHTYSWVTPTTTFGVCIKLPA